MDNSSKYTKTKTVNSPYPYYIVAALWLIGAFIFNYYKLPVLLIIGAISIVVYIIAKKIFSQNSCCCRGGI